MATDSTDTRAAPSSDLPKDSLPDHYFELYNVAVEMADRTSARRLTANAFFVTINMGLAALLGVHAFRWYVSAAGVVLAVVWWALLKSYRDINRAKYEVINAMEELLPVPIFGNEWAILKPQRQASSVLARSTAVIGRGGRIKAVLRDGTRREWLTQYWELGTVERVVPWIFAVIYLVDLFSRIVP